MAEDFICLRRLPENARIEVLAEQVQQGHEIAFVVETEIKANRYLRKLGSRVREIERFRITKDGQRLILVSIGPVRH